MNDSEQRAPNAPAPAASATSSSPVVGAPLPPARPPTANSTAVTATGSASVRPSARPPSGFPTAPSSRPLAGIDVDRAYRPWNVRRPNGTRAALPNNGELRAWIADGRITPEDELSPDGQHWTPLRAIANIDVFIAAAPPARTRRASSMNMPAVRLPTDEAVRAPALGAVPAAPKVPSLAGLEGELEQGPVQPAQPAPRASVAPPSGGAPSVRVPPPASPSKPAPPLSPLTAGARPAGAASVPPPSAVMKNNTPSIAPLPKPNANTVASAATRSAPPLAEPLFGAPLANATSTAAATPQATASAAPLTTESAAAPSPPSARSRTPTLPPPAISAPAHPPAQTTASATVSPRPEPAVEPEPAALFATREPAPAAAAESLPPTVDTPRAPSASAAEAPAIFGSDSIVPPEPRRAEPVRAPEPARAEAAAESERKRTRSMPPPPSITVDPTVYEEASRQQSIVRPTPAAPSWKLNAALALSLLAALTGGAAFAKAMTANRPVISAEPSAPALPPTMPSPASRAELDQAIEALSATIHAHPTLGLAKVRRARMLALRAEYQRGVADDLDALARQHAGDEATLDRAEARVLRRAALQDAVRAMGDVRAVRAVVPPANVRAEWMLSLAHGAVAYEPSSREASEYRRGASAAGAPTHLLDAIVARARSEDSIAAFERARAEQDAPVIAMLSLVRAQRAADHREEARRALGPWAAEHMDDEATAQLARTLGDAAPPSPAPQRASAEPPQSADPQSANAEPATTPSTPAGQAAVPAQSGAISPQYLSHVQAGRRALEFRMLPRARAEFRRALEFKSDGVEAQIGLAWVALRIGYYPVAAQSFRRLYAQGHNTPEVRAGLGLTHAKMREREPAIRYLRAYLASGPQGALAQEARQALAQLGAG